MTALNGNTEQMFRFKKRSRRAVKEKMIFILILQMKASVICVGLNVGRIGVAAKTLSAAEGLLKQSHFYNASRGGRAGRSSSVWGLCKSP